MATFKVELLDLNETIEVEENTSYESIAQKYQDKFDAKILAVVVNNKLKELFKTVKFDCKLKFVTLASLDGERIYSRSLSFVADVAARSLFSHKLYIYASLHGGLYCTLKPLSGVEKPLPEGWQLQLKEKMAEIIAKDMPFIKVKMPKERALKVFKQADLMDKYELFSLIPRQTISIYYLGEYVNYFYGHLVPSTGYLDKFDVKPYKDGFILLYPRWQHYWDIAEFKEMKNLSTVYEEYSNWLKVLGMEKISDINKMILDGKIKDLILLSEALQEKKIAQIADKISEKIDKVRVILIAGPSSSGKTTFSKRLAIQLRVNGVKPIPISLDNYFLDRDKTPKDENGKPDWESIYALNIELLNEHLNKLFDGKEVELPYYDFRTGKSRPSGEIIKLDKDAVLILEGIHALNDKLTPHVDPELKFKIYISALTQLHIDDTNRIPTTDTRLIRRIVRDHKFRGHSPKQTIQMWSMVRRGEERWIFPFQEQADAYFNSALVYELGILRKYAVPLLSEITRDQPEFVEASRLLRFLGYFLPMEEEGAIPLNSILREFIGGSCFKY